MWRAGTDRRAYLVGVVANLAVDAALEAGRPLAREELGFAKEHDTNRAFNRYSSNFPYSELAEPIDRRARRFGVSAVLVDPAYTSVEGRWRCAEVLGRSVHEAAALCIGRKALGHRRRFSPKVQERIGRVCQALDAASQRREVEVRDRRLWKKALRRTVEPGPSRPTASGSGPCWGRRGSCAPMPSGSEA